jgi:2-succinyl-5-enolpyruvyl-6-hydroxy-3-cyclohexene-1-carboxylate synthase
MLHSRLELAQQVVQAAIEHGVKHVVISPGSRNAPLIIEWNAYSEIEKYSIVDERSAAFFALGKALQTGEAVALVCTSGSALLNYYPALAEAYYSDIPLLVLSADRPKRLIDIGDGQTIRQENVFQNHVWFNANLIEDDTLENIALLQEAFRIFKQKKAPYPHQYTFFGTFV